MQTVRSIVIALVIAAGSAGCGDDVSPSGDTTTTVGGTTTTAEGPPARKRCDAPLYSVEYPSDWFTTERFPRCRFFHSAPFDLDEGTEFFGAAISVQVVEGALDAVVAADTTGPHVREVADSQMGEVDGRTAQRVEAVLGDDGLLPAGTRATTWYIDAGDATLVAVTYDLAGLGSYSANVAVLEEMIGTLRLVEGSPTTCSATGLSPSPAPQPDLPAAVVERRAAIVAAAVGCDYAALASEMADEFTASFGGDDPITLWRHLEERQDGEPLRFLVELLDRPFGRDSTGNVVRYVWPSAFGFGSWDAVPEQDREALRPLYGDDDFAGFAAFGGYVGYRVGISETGDWSFFVAGD